MGRSAAARYGILALACGAIGLAAPARAGLIFNDTYDTTDGALSTQQLQSIQYAQSAWSSLIVANPTTSANDNLTVNQTYSSQNLADFGGTGAPAYSPVYSPGISTGTFPYSEYLAALNSHASSAVDQAVVAKLNAGVVNVTDGYFPSPGVSGFQTRSNYGTSLTPSVRTMSSGLITLSTMNAKALGIPLSDDVLGGANFNGDGSDGISDLLINPDSFAKYYYGPANTPTPAGETSYTLLIMASIGKTLGLVSGVETLENYRYSSAPLADQPTNATDDSVELHIDALDLFRYRTVNGQLARSFELGQDTDYFSIDGRTSLGQFNSGYDYGNGFEPSSIAAANGVSSIDPNFVSPGEVGETAAFSNTDITVFDALGYTTSQVAHAPSYVPEPSMAAIDMVYLVALSRRRRPRLVITAA